VAAPDAAVDDTVRQSQAWATLLERLVRGLEGGSRQWTIGRRKDSVRRLLASNRSDMQRLRQRLEPLIAAWELDRSLAPGHAVEIAGVPSEAELAEPASGGVASDWPPLVASLESTLRAALPREEPRAVELADELAQLVRRIGVEGAHAEIVREVETVCQRARRLLVHRQHLVDELARLCAGLTEGLTELSEDDSWARGQAQAMQLRLAEGVSARSVRAAGELLAETRARQQGLRAERDAARDALKALIPGLLAELAALEDQTGRFEGSVGRHALAIEGADSLQSLAGVVRAIVDETRAVQQAVGSARARLQDESSRAAELQGRVQQLESELRRLSEEVSTDALTQVANRRGLQAAFEAEVAKIARDSGPLAKLSIGLIDIDNFKKLNDSLGHAAGDVALQALAARVRDSLRPLDTVARFGGEEFVVLLPGLPVAEGQGVLTRLQRELTASLFMHEKREVFVTFSAGVTAWRTGEALQSALERADEALYEAKRTGKNRTCLG